MSTKYHGTACKTCRRRGRKCTKELPYCHSCLNKGIKCEGYALKWAGLASRGRLAGKKTLDETMPHAKSRPVRQTRQRVASPVLHAESDEQPDLHDLSVSCSSEQTIFDILNEVDSINFSPSQFDEIVELDFDINSILTDNISRGDIDCPFDKSKMILPAADLVLYSDLLDPYNVPFELKFILNYHLLEVAPRLCVDNSSLKNPYTQYIIPLAVQKPPLLYACAALAACHFSVRLSDQKLLVDCLRFRGKAMRRLQEYLWSELSARDEGNLGAVLMLTLTDMCLGGFSNFDAHFSAARRLIDLRGENRTPDSFVEQYIAWLDIMSAASNHRKPLFSSRDIMELTGPTKEWSHDVFPCPPDQFAIVSQIVELYKSQDDPAEPSSEVMEQVEQRKTDLLTQQMHTERGSYWLHLTEAYRHAIVLYIIRLFKCHTDEDEISWLTQSVFYHSKCTPPLTGWADQLLWPLFHAGLEIRDERRQNWLRERSKVMQLSGGFKNVDTAMAILEKVWKSGSVPDYMSLLSEDGVANMLVV